MDALFIRFRAAVSALIAWFIAEAKLAGGDRAALALRNAENLRLAGHGGRPTYAQLEAARRDAEAYAAFNAERSTEAVAIYDDMTATLERARAGDQRAADEQAARTRAVVRELADLFGGAVSHDRNALIASAFERSPREALAIAEQSVPRGPDVELVVARSLDLTPRTFTASEGAPTLPPDIRRRISDRLDELCRDLGGVDRERARALVAVRGAWYGNGEADDRRTVAAVCREQILTFAHRILSADAPRREAV